MKWFFRQLDTTVFCITEMETRFSHLRQFEQMETLTFCKKEHSVRAHARGENPALVI